MLKELMTHRLSKNLVSSTGDIVDYRIDLILRSIGLD